MGKRKDAKQAAAWRTTAFGHARDWALRIWHDRLDAPPPYDHGIVLWDGERVLGRVPVCVSQLITTTHQERRQKLLLGVIQPIDHRWIVQDVTNQQWIGGAPHELVVTNMRAVYRDASGYDGVAWRLVNAVDIDLDNDRVQIDGTDDNGNPFTIGFTGPTVAPIAVAAVGFCHGPEAMAAHPRLACLRAPLRNVEAGDVPQQITGGTPPEIPTMDPAQTGPFHL